VFHPQAIANLLQQARRLLSPSRYTGISTCEFHSAPPRPI